MVKGKFKRNIGITHRVIRTHLVKNPKLIVHGARAQNVQLPRNLERKSTVDWDIFSNTPKKSAIKLEKKLDKRFRGNFFEVKEGATKRLQVHKVKSVITGESFADFSIPDRMVEVIAKRGKKFASLSDQKMRAQQNLTNPEALFRREKDLNLLMRIKKFEKLRGRKI